MVMPMLTIVNDHLCFEFGDIHPEAKLNINFQRTLRIPDDGKEYPLPPGLGLFPLRQVDDFKDNVPAKWVEHGGIFLPLYQSEALWLSFRPNSVDRRGTYPFAIKVAAGKVSAVTGNEWTSGLTAKDYLVAPKQPWLDGYAVGNGLIRQFVAAPLGTGFSVEEQLTGKAEFGGIQIEVFPMKWEVFKEKFPKAKPENIIRSRSMKGISGQSAGMLYASSSLCRMESDSDEQSLDMSLAAGGKMKQQIFDDPYQLSDWDTDKGIRCFVHLANSVMWRGITKTDPPHIPFTVQDYARRGLPWYDYYSDSRTLEGTEKLKGVKSLAEIAGDKGIKPLIIPDNSSVSVPTEKISHIGPEKRPGIRTGNW